MVKFRLAMPSPVPKNVPAWFGALMRMPLALSVALAIGAGLGFSIVVVLSLGGDSPQQVADIHPLERLAPADRDRHIAELPNQQGAGHNRAPLADDAPDVVRAQATGNHGVPADDAPMIAISDDDGSDRERLMGVDVAGPMPPGHANAAHSASQPEANDGAGEIFRTAHQADGDRPQVAILLRDVGLDPSLAEQSVALPDAIMIGMSPYIAHGPSWHDYMHREGHETALMLPVAGRNRSDADGGPLALTLAAVDGNEANALAGVLNGALDGALRRILKRASGFAAVAASARGFATEPERFAPVAAQLSADGIGFVELDGEALAAPAQSAGLAYASATIALDDHLDPAEIDRKLQRLALIAKRSGQAIAHTSPYPIVLDRIWNWANALDEQSPALVPVSQLLQSQPASG